MRQDDAIAEAAWLYYQDGLNQTDIAVRLNVSRATVVNYLTEARKRDYVRITLDSDVFLANNLAAQLRESCRLAQALVVPHDVVDASKTAARVTRAASDWLPALLVPGDQLGIAWGETIWNLAEQAPRLTLQDLTVVQLVGSRPATLGFAAEACAAMLASRFGAACINLHVPLLLSDPDLCRRLVAEPVVADQLRAVAQCNKVVFAAGTCNADSHIVRAGILDAKTMATFRANGATGVICGRLISADGTPIPLPIEDRMIGVTLQQMHAKEMRILVSAGIDRAEATLAAVRGGFVTHLATCSETARFLIAKLAGLRRPDQIGSPSI
jgi:deoxyribonucleoside regulator